MAIDDDDDDDFVHPSQEGDDEYDDDDDDDNDDDDGSTVLVVGASGGTGLRALSSLINVGWHPSTIRFLTRNVTSARATLLRRLGFDVRYADMDVPSTLSSAVRGCTGCYVHSTSGDLRELDDGEVRRATNLALAIYKSNSDIDHGRRGGGDDSSTVALHSMLTRVVYNSAAAEDGHGVCRIMQKHDVERAFREVIVVSTTSDASDSSFVSLSANLFMEELWKGYTRPAILRGRYPFSVRPDQNVYLTSVRDMGRLAGTILTMPNDAYRNWTSKNNDSVINVAGDVLTPRTMAETFDKVQNSTCVHDRGQLFGLFARLFFRDLYEVIRFYRTSTEITNVEALRTRFPGLLTTFEEFLVETRWADADRVYEDLSIAD